jgi:acyl-CoA thioesterase-1
MRACAKLLGVLLIVISWSTAAAQQPARKPAPRRPVNESLKPIEDNPKLPRVLLIGDSISIGYTLPVRELLAERANLHRIPANGSDTRAGLANIDKWLGDGKWDVIHFNWGLHDIKHTDDGKNPVPLDEYKQNLQKLVDRLQQTGARLIWASTTPVPDSDKAPLRHNSDVLAYNKAALKIMEAEHIAMDDLYTFAKGQIDAIQLPDNVHFSLEGSKTLATRVAASIEAALTLGPPSKAVEPDAK